MDSIQEQIQNYKKEQERKKKEDKKINQYVKSIQAYNETFISKDAESVQAIIDKSDTNDIDTIQAYNNTFTPKSITNKMDLTDKEIADKIISHHKIQNQYVEERKKEKEQWIKENYTLFERFKRNLYGYERTYPTELQKKEEKEERDNKILGAIYLFIILFVLFGLSGGFVN